MITTLLRLNRYSVWLCYAAIIAFIVSGTAASLPSLRQNQWVYWLFYYVPFVLIGLTIPVSLLTGLILWRWRITQPSILLTVFMTATLCFFLSAFVAFIAWLGIVFLLRVNLNRYHQFLQASSTSNPPTLE